MAVVKTGHNKWESYVAYLEESTFGTANAGSSNFIKIDTVGGNTPSFNPEFFVDKTMRNRDENVFAHEDYFSTNNGLWQRYEVPEFIATSENLAEFLYGAVQTVSEAAGSPFEKTYTVDGEVNPDFSSNAGFFMTLLVNHPESGGAQTVTSCVVENLRIRFSSADQGGRCLCSATLLSGSGYDGTITVSGTNDFSSATVPTFHNATSTFTLNSIDAVWYEFELNIASRFAWLGYSSGDAQSYKYLGSDFTGRAVLKYDTNVDEWLRSKGSNEADLDFDIGTNAAAGFFAFDAPYTFIDNVVTDASEDGDVQKLILDMTFALDSSAGTDIVLKVADGVDQTW